MRLPLAPSDKTHLVTIQRRAAGKDGRGNPNGAWQDQHTDLWASVKPIRSREWFAASQAQTSADVVVSLDYLSDLQPTDRVVCEGQPYEIVGEPIDVENRHHTWELMCLKGQRDGR